MAAYYACAALALLRWAATRDRHDAALAALLALACTQIAKPGLAWALTLVPGVIVALLPRIGLKIAAAGLAFALFVLAVLAQTRMVVMGHCAASRICARRGRRSARATCCSATGISCGTRCLPRHCSRGGNLATPTLAPLTVVAATGAILLFAVFAFPEAAGWLAGQTTFNRATLHFAPVAVVFAALAFQEFAARWRAAAADARGS